MERNQFTFYRSYWEALRELPKKDRSAILDALIPYALDGAEPSGLTKMQSAVFALVRPTLDSGRKKAKAGKLGGSGKQNESNTEANGKQNEAPHKHPAREKEGEKEGEKDKELEKEGENDKRSTAPASDGKAFTSFWEAYPRKIDRESAWKAWVQLNPSPDLINTIMSALDAWKASGQWTDDGGRFVPKAEKWLLSGYYQSPPAPAKGSAPQPRQLDEYEIAAIKRMMEGGDIIA